MAGTVDGGKQAATTNKELYGQDWYQKIGALGGSVARRETRHFYLHPEVARVAGHKGGTISRRGKANTFTTDGTKWFPPPKYMKPSLVERLRKAVKRWL